MADRCWRCGVEVGPQHAFCPSCGARVKAETPDLDLFTDVADEPPAPPVEANDPDDRRRMIVAGVSFVVALVGFFWITRPADEPSADPFDERSDFDVTDGVIGSDPVITSEATPMTFGDLAGPLEWEVTQRDGQGIPLAMIEIDGSLFTYTLDLSNTFAWQGFVGDLAIAQRTPEGTWLDHGSLGGPGSNVTAVASASDGAVAAGLDADGAPTVWRSNDGISWVAEPLPSTSLGSDVSYRPTAIVEHDGVVLVAGQATETWQLIAAGLQDRFGDVLSVINTGWSQDENGIAVQGPFQLDLAQVPIEDFGLEPDDFTADGNRRPAPVWIFDDAAWTSTVLGGEVTSFTTRNGDGSIYLTTATNTGVDVAVYREGQWGGVDTQAIDWQLHHGAAEFSSMGDRRVLNILDGRLQLAAEVVLPADAGYVSAISAGARGTAVSVIDWDTVESEMTMPTEQLVLLRDGFRLTTADDGVRLELSAEDLPVLQIEPWNSELGVTHDVVLDDGEPRVVFLSPDDGAALVHFTIGELRELEIATEPRYDTAGPTSIAVLFAEDPTSQWFGGLVDDGFDTPAGATTQLQLLDDRIVLAVIDVAPGDASFRYTLLEAPIPG